MTQQTRTALKELQKLDMKIQDAQERVRAFDPLFAEVEEPALILESEVGNTRKRLQEMKLEERRLELATEEKSARTKKLEERLKSVRNLREEAAVTAELDMVKRALQSDEQEALSLIDQIRKMEERLEELEEAWEEAKAQVEPKRQELLDERQGVKDELEGLQKDREEFVSGLDPEEVKMYEGIRSGGREVAVAELTPDGACDHCFTMVPLQVQNEILHGDDLIRCEGCGVILSAPGPEEDEEPAAEADDEAADEAGDGPAAEADDADDADDADEVDEVEADADDADAEETPAQA